MSLACAMASASSVKGIRQATGPEDFLLRDAHAVVDVGEYGGPHDSCPSRTAAELGGVAGARGRRTTSVAPSLRAELDVAAHLGEVSMADHGADHGCFIKRVAHTDAAGARRLKRAAKSA